ncbi:hypothetical protein COY87_03200 [Candidatus Roizmanbacteria bacterium CG_4_10_14_0_8_um_filter_33_9]|uniref:Uncharacterized protein n=1 Tax=Candidatus Roizmanbacteria bacterium CG_4_10_14_0_8_um_filter_33_9 TaxID=1974826 RepID=A0A2M7QJ66_9BACT|nr:MAG: hypothetical protein COY87_03200 [Candidatus Roizmanbacteria bacterium CG_4_10_14_0_8_um_filter_33_9]
MCYLVPYKVKSIDKNVVMLTNGMKAFYDKKVGKLHANDEVMVYGNLIINKVTKHEKHKTNS